MAKSTERRIAEKIAAALNVLDIDPIEVGAYLSFSGESIQTRLYKIFMKLLYNWALKYDHNDYTEGTEFEGVVIHAKRIVEIHERGGGVRPD